MKTKKLYLALGLGLSLTLTGCSSDSTQPEAETHDKTSVTSPHTGETAAPKADKALTGTITETFNSGGYTYLVLDNGQDKIWAAIGETTVEVGQEITLKNGPVMKDFHSRTLDRTFPEIVFSAGIAGEDKKGGHAMLGKAPTTEKSGAKHDEENFMEALGTTDNAAIDPAQASGGSEKAVVNATDIHIDKATGPNAYTVEELYTQAKELHGKTVVIKAKVVKISPQIMGKNWLHLQDGTGNSIHNTHDLVATTSEVPELDSVILIEGVVAADKDFGAGYFYTVIVEEGVVKK